MDDELESYTESQSEEKEEIEGKEENEEKNNYWWTVEFSTALSQNDRSLKEELMSTVAAISNSIGSEIHTERQDSGDYRLFLKAHYNGSRGIDELAYELESTLKDPAFKGIEISRCYKTSNQPWEKQHYDAFPPLPVGKKLVVMAPWHEKENTFTERMPIYIYPATAFGTGYHESTRIALTLLEGAVKGGDTILDVGTGTGILFIAALKLGAGKAIARDIDPTTLEEAKRNMNLNGINPKVCDLSVADLLKGFRDQVNVLTANILLNPNLAMLPDVRRVLKPKGTAIFSGMTSVESHAFMSVLKTSGMTVDKELRYGDWWGCRAVTSWG